VSEGSDLSLWLFIASLAAIWFVLTIWLVRGRSSRWLKICAASAMALVTANFVLEVPHSIRDANVVRERARATERSANALQRQLKSRPPVNEDRGK
jgi:hypothetical protein